MGQEMRPLVKGVAYHGNRMLTHVREDLRDIVEHGFNNVVHMFSHNDWDRHKNIMGEIIKMTKDAGLDVWVDNWGLGGPPGDKSHFLAYYPNAHQYYSNGEMAPVHACYNNQDFVQFTKNWIDVVLEAGGEKIFWDEPHLIGEDMKDGKPGKWTCRCTTCQKLFSERYGKPMPSVFTPEVAEFRLWTVANYFQTVTAYAKKHQMENIICVMMDPSYGINLDTMDQLCGIETLDNIGSDPYWHGKAHGYEDVYRYVYERSKQNMDVCAHFKKNHNLWVQAFMNETGTEEEIIAATDAIYDAGARNIFVWGYRGSDANDYRSSQPDAAWKAVGDAMARITERDRNERLARARKLV